MGETPAEVAPAQQPAPEQQAQNTQSQAAARAEISPELAKLLSETYGISEVDLRLALEKSDVARRALSALDLIGRASSLSSKEARLAALPHLLRASSDEAEMASFVKWLLLLRESKDRTPEILVRLLMEERERLLKQLVEGSTNGTGARQAQKAGGPRDALDELERLATAVERLRRLAELFNPPRSREPGLAEALEVLAKYASSGQRDEVMRKILLEVFNLGAESGRARAESDRAKYELVSEVVKSLFNKMSDGAMDTIAYAFANLLNAVAQRLHPRAWEDAPQPPPAPPAPAPALPAQQPAPADLPPSVKRLLEKIPPKSRQ